MGFIGTTAAVGLGTALSPFFGFLLRVFGLFILLGMAMYACGDGEPVRVEQPAAAEQQYEQVWPPKVPVEQPTCPPTCGERPYPIPGWSRPVERPEIRT